MSSSTPLLPFCCPLHCGLFSLTPFILESVVAGTIFEVCEVGVLLASIIITTALLDLLLLDLFRFLRCLPEPEPLPLGQVWDVSAASVYEEEEDDDDDDDEVEVEEEVG